MTEQTDGKTLRKVYNAEHEWLTLAQRYEIYLEEVQPPHTRFEYGTDGLKRIPITNKQWVNYTGMETPSHTGLVWLKPGKHYRAKDKLDHIINIKYYNGFEFRLIGCLVKNSLLCKKLAGVNIRLEAIKDTLHHYLKDYTDCPIHLLDRVTDAVGFAAMIELDSRANCTLEEIGSINGKYATSRGAIDYACRSDLWNMLNSRGIGSLRTRRQQEDLIDKVLSLPKFAHLKKEVKAALLFRLRRYNMLKPDTDKVKDRVADITLKKMSHIPLSDADRKYVSKHKDLFTF